MFKHYLTTAFRNLRRDKNFSLINVMGLGLGMVVFIIIQLWIGYEKSFDRFHENADRIYRLIVDLTSPNKPVTIWQTTPAPMGPLMEDKIPEIEKIIRLSFPWGIRLQKGEDSFSKSVIYADSVFFEYFSFPLVSGAPGQILDERNAIAISESLAKDMFGEMDPVGQTLDVKEGFSDQIRPVIITGVFNDIPENSSIRFDAVIPFNTYLNYAIWNQHWGNYNNFTYAVLNRGVDPDEVNEKIKDFIKENRPDSEEKYAELFLHPLTKLHLYDDFSKGREPGGTITYVNLFEIVSFFVLIIAIINFINLSTANLSRRQKEAGLKKILGAGRKTLTRQFMMESFLLNLVAIILALLSVYLLLPEFNRIFHRSVNLPDTGEMIFLSGCILLGTSLITGLYPSYLISGIEPVNAVKGKEWRIGNVNLRDGLVVFQFILSISLIIGILVVYKQVEYIRNKNLGFDRENILRFSVGEIQNYQEAFRQELEKIPGVNSITYIIRRREMG